MIRTFRTHMYVWTQASLALDLSILTVCESNHLWQNNVGNKATKCGANMVVTVAVDTEDSQAHTFTIKWFEKYF